jgi:hypothetical protein
MSPGAVASPSHPEPTPNLRVLAKRYERIAAQSNRVACAFSEALATSDLAMIRKRADRFAHAQRVAADQLRKLDFPRDVQAMVDEVIANRAALEAGSSH